MYYIKSAFNSLIKYNIKMYPHFVVSFVAGCCIIFMVLSGLISYFGPYMGYMQNFTDSDITIDVNKIRPESDYSSRLNDTQKIFMDRNDVSYPVDEYAYITYDDVIYIRQNFNGDFTFKCFLLSSDFIYGDNIKERLLHKYYLSNDYFHFFKEQTGLQNDFIVAPRDVVDSVINGLQQKAQPNSLNSFPFEYDENKKCFVVPDTEAEIDIVYLEDIKNMKSFDSYMFATAQIELESNNFNYSNVMFIPLEYAYIKYAPELNDKFYIRIVDVREKSSLTNLLLYLNEAHSRVYSYTLTETVSTLLRIISDYVLMFIILSAIAVSLIFITSVNLLGMQLFIFEKQKHNIAVNIFCGANNKFIITAYLFINCIVTTLGGILGSVIGYFIINHLKIQVYKTLYIPKTGAFTITVLFAFALGIITILPLLYKIYKLYPLELLNNDV